MRLKLGLVFVALAMTLVFQNCGSELDYDEYSADLSSSAATTVPQIIDFPTNFSLITGQPLSISVVAGGGGLSYQWYKNGLIISGATDFSYEIASVNTSHSGSYSVVVKNSLGEATRSVVVTVSNPQPTVTPTPTPVVTVTPTPTPTPTPIPQAKPICSVWYQARDDKNISGIVKDGVYSYFSSGEDKNCDDGICGIRMGVSCTGGDQIRLVYQFQFISRQGAEITTPWSGLSGVAQWGTYSSVYYPSQPTGECRAPLLCGIRARVETMSGQTCNLSYQYIAEAMVSPLQSNGAWSNLPDMGSREDNCNSSPCGMRAVLSCP